MQGLSNVSTGLDLTFMAGEDLTADQYKVVTVDANGRALKIDAANEFPCGVLQSTPVNGQSCAIRVRGVTKCVAQATITRGDIVQAHFTAGADEGKVKPWTIGTDGHNHGGAASNPPATGTLDCILGIALSSAAAGELVSVLLCQQAL